MGNSWHSKANTTSLSHDTFHIFEVFEIPTQLYSKPSNSTPPKWCERKFFSNSSNLIVYENSQFIENIAINSNFEVINEQPDDFIFSISFKSSSGSRKTWKVKYNTSEQYEYLKTVLQQILKKQWKNSKNCEICEKSFGVIRRKHHCRRCGKCICENCSSFRVTLPELTYKELVRVCEKCAKVMKEMRKGVSEAQTPNFLQIRTKDKKSLIHWMI